jgi:galactokinase
VTIPVGTATGSSATLVLANGSASSAVLEINSLTVNNVDGVNSADVSVLRFVGTNSTQLYTTISVPADASLRVVDGTAKLVLPEDHTIRVFANATGDLTVDVAYVEYK